MILFSVWAIVKKEIPILYPALGSLLGTITLLSLNYTKILSIGTSYFAKSLEFTHLFKSEKIFSLWKYIFLEDLLIHIIIIYFTIQLFRKTRFNTIGKIFAHASWINLGFAIVYSIRSIFLPYRYLVFTSSVILFYPILQWSKNRLTAISILFMIPAGFYLSQNETTSFAKEYQYIDSLIEVKNAYPGYTILVPYWNYRPLLLYSEVLHDGSLYPIDRNLKVSSWIAPRHLEPPPDNTITIATKE